MRKTRILASLLCLMMVVCALPVMQASAAVGDTDSSIAAVMGVNNAINVYDLQIDADFDGTDVDTTVATEDTYTADGVEFEAESGSSTSWVIQPEDDFWTATNAVVFKAKIGSGNRLTIYTEGGSRVNSDDKTVSRGYLLLADNRVYARPAGGSLAAGTVNDEVFLLGDEWFELMVVHGETTFEVYVKNNHSNGSYDSTNGVWTKLNYTDTLPYEHGHAGTTENHHFYASNKVGDAGNKTYLKSVSVFHEDTRMHTIEDALAERAGISDGMIATSNAWKFANSTMTTYYRASNTAIVVPEGMAYTDEGLDLSKTNGTDVWKFSAYAGWSPVANKNTTDAFRALYVKVKGNVTIGYLMSDGKSIDKIRSVPGQTLRESNVYAMDGTTSASGTRDGFNVNPTIDNNWIEYLIIPRNTNASYVYAKSATLTDNVWVKAVSIDRYCYASDSSDPNYATYRQNGVSFEGSGVVDQFRTIDFNTAARTLVAADSATKPANANYLYFDEEFNNTPIYNNVSVGNAFTIADGVATANTKYKNEAEGIAATSGALFFSHLEIPVNGYMDIKMKSNGVKRITIADDNTVLDMNVNCDYSGFPGTSALYGGYMADSDMSWRTWRFVRTADGYNVYSKTEGDSGWRMHTSNVNVDAGSTTKRIRFEFYGNADGKSDGNGMVDYIKIYGTAPADALTLTDGYGTEVIADGTTLTYPKALRAIVTEDAGKLLVVTYKGNDMLKAQIVNVEDMVNKSAIFDARGTNADMIKVFLWDSFSGLNRKTPVVTLGL